MKKLILIAALLCLAATGCGQQANLPSSDVSPIRQEALPEEKSAKQNEDSAVRTIAYGPHLLYGPFLQAKRPTARPLASGIMPKWLNIPAIHLETVVEPVGVLPNGQMDVPKAFDRVGILAPWTKPGMRGSAVIAGHFDHYTGPAVFYHLRKLQPGDHVLVRDESGKTLTFEVTKVESFPADQAPIEQIFGDSDQSQLNLITCAGRFNKKKQEHAKRLVVFSELVQ